MNIQTLGAKANLGDALDADLGRQMLAVFDAMADGVWVCSAEPRLLYINSACEQLNDIRREEVCGRSVSELLGMGNFDHDVTSLVLRQRTPMAISQKVRSGRTLLVQAAPVFNEHEELVYVVGTERDLTELNILRGDLEESHATIRKMRSEIVALKLAECDLGEVVAESDAMQRVMELVLRVADFDANVLLSGPTGTGKSLLARMIHQTSKRREKPFLSINCGAIPANLLEAELFGYAPGAFTGADKRGKPGLVEAADGGTLFLDEIDAFPTELQVKLLTFLDTQNFMRLGDIKPRQVDARLISATNTDLDTLVEQDRFRSDLHFRLSVVPVAVPPLRDRCADIPPLVRSALTRMNTRHETTITIAGDALEALCRYDFPGNVRELQNLLERAMVLCDGKTIRLADLPAVVRCALGSSPLPAGNGLGARMREVEYRILRDACQTWTRQVDIAAALDVSQATVARLLKKHGLVAGNAAMQE